jgi:hypothetical protein
MSLKKAIFIFFGTRINLIVTIAKSFSTVLFGGDSRRLASKSLAGLKDSTDKIVRSTNGNLNSNKN